MKKIISILMVSILFFGCHESEKINKTPEKTTYKETKKNDVYRIELKTQLNYNGTVMPFKSYSDSQYYAITNGTCKNPGKEVTIIDACNNYHNDVDGNIIADNKGLLPYGKEFLIEDAAFCIEKTKDKTYVYIEDSFKRQINKKDALIGIEKLVDAINKSKFGENINIRDFNEKTW